MTSDLSHGAVRAGVLLATAILSLSELARASELEMEAGLGIGMTVLGGRRATGGVTLLPSGAIGWHFAEWGSISYRNALPIFNWKTIRWIGVIDTNTALLGIHLGRVTLELGPSLDVFAVPLCATTGCQREHGLAPAGHLGAALLPAPSGRFIVGTTAHLTAIRGIAWSGVSFSAAVEGRYQW